MDGGRLRRAWEQGPEPTQEWGRTVEVFVLSLTPVGNCRSGWNRDRRRLRAELLRGGQQHLRMDRLITLLKWLTFLELLIQETRNVALGQKVIKFFAGVHGVSHKHRKQASDREILACLDFDAPWNRRIDRGRLWLRDFADRP
jgi:hypothetical protein